MGDTSQVSGSNIKEVKKSFKASVFRSEFSNKKDTEFLEFKRNLNKLLLDEETVEQIEDARESKFYFEKMRCLELCRLTLMVMAQTVAIVKKFKIFKLLQQKKYEIEFESMNDEYAMWFLYITLFLSILLTNQIYQVVYLILLMIVIMTYFSYSAQNQFIIATKKLGNQATIYNTGQWRFMLIEMSIYLVFPQPWFSDIKVNFFVDFNQINVFHYLNEILLLIMLLRFLIMVKIILINTQWYSEKVNRVCNLYATKMSPIFIIKVNMKKNPMKVFWFCYVFSLAIYSYAIRICERPLLRDENESGAFDFSFFPTAVWCMMISIPSVGYGDRYPTTLHGRFIAVCSFISGTFMLSVLCNSLIIILDFNYLEAKAHLIIQKLNVREEIKLTAIKMFSYVARMASRRRKNKLKSMLLARKLRQSADYFKSINREYKSLVDESNFGEQIDKQFTYLREELGSYQNMLSHAIESQKSIVQQIQSIHNQPDNFLQASYQGHFSMNNINSNMMTSQTEQNIGLKQKTHKRQQFSSLQYYTDDMQDAGIKQKPYNFQYNMVNHVHPNQFY